MTNKTVAERAATERYVEDELDGEIEKATEVCNSHGVSGWAYDFLRVCATLAQAEAELEQAEAQSKEAMELLRERSQALHQLHKKPSKFVATWLICPREPCPSDRIFLLQPQPTTKEEEPTMTQAEAGKVIEESSHSYEPPSCVRVSIMTAVGARYRYYICAIHDCPWPDEEEGECDWHIHDMAGMETFTGSRSACPYNPCGGNEPSP